ncbi:MAG TPA: hypothetical protein VLQ48_01150 [Chloroflexia bacterium]|nr:hypothetical protein [Chloroflexia bacterium]
MPDVRLEALVCDKRGSVGGPTVAADGHKAGEGIRAGRLDAERATDFALYCRRARSRRVCFRIALHRVGDTHRERVQHESTRANEPFARLTRNKGGLEAAVLACSIEVTSSTEHDHIGHKWTTGAAISRAMSKATDEE